MNDTSHKLSTYLSPAGAWAFALGTSIGWGSLIVTGSSYLKQAGPVGSSLGLGLGLGIMLLIAASYHFLLKNHANAGGIYGIARDLFGYDHGILVAWFIVLAYMAMFWANATSLPLFARFFLGDLFQFGFHYQFFGFDVYLGEILLSAIFIGLAGLVCTLNKKGVSLAMIIMAVIIAVGITGTFVAAISQRDTSAATFKPYFVPGSNPLVQVIHLACISSWAFIGFESISNQSEEFSFSKKKTFAIFGISLATITALYIFVTLLSVTAYPTHYANWLEYIVDMGNNSGIAAVPAFYAANYYLGQIGPIIFMVVLLCLVFTSLIGNLTSLSRLFYTLSQDGIVPKRLGAVNKHGVPSLGVGLVALVSLVIPFFGRTAIGWIVDVTTITATLIYGFVSACAFKEGRQNENTVERNCGLIGLILMVSFGLYLLLPSIFGTQSLESETYFLFAFWSMLGFVYFRRLLRMDTQRRFGKSTIAWLALLALVVFTGMAWMGQTSDMVTRQTMTRVQEYYAGASNGRQIPAEETVFLEQRVTDLDRVITRGMFGVAGMFMASLVVMLRNFTIMREREEESHERAKTAHTIANTDPLTGVKSKHAYLQMEAELNARLEKGELRELAVVVCDVNGLKQVNDIQGHKAGDAYIKSASQLICTCFKHSPVYRIGGDEFVAILQGSDFASRKSIMATLNQQVEANRDVGKVVVAAGISDLQPYIDKEFHAAFERADALMYQRKIQLKRPGEEVR